MPLKYLEDSGYTGINRDTPPWLLGPGELADGLNLLFDRPGVARLRNGTAFLGAGTGATSAAIATALGWAYSQDATPIETLYALDGRSGQLYAIDPVSGAPTAVFNSGYPTAVGRAFRHAGFIYFPGKHADGRRLVICAAGQVNSTLAANSGAVAQVTAQNSQVTLTGSDTTANFKVGAMFKIFSPLHSFYGRIVSIDSSTKFSVWPKPDYTDAAVPSNSVTANPGLVFLGGLCGTSFQNRLLIGNTTEFSVAQGSSTWDRRIYYSPLQTETLPSVTGATYSGAVFNDPSVWPQYNYIEMPGADPIVAIEPLTDNELLILTTTHPVIFRGNLVTQTGVVSPTVTFDILDINMAAGCASDHSVQRTPRGVMWASAGGVYVFTGSGEAVNVLQGKMANWWRGLGSQAGFAVHGSFFMRGHYGVCGAVGSNPFCLLVNLTSRDAHVYNFSLLDNMDIFHAVARPSNSMQNYAARWTAWPSGGPSPFRNGQIMRIDPIFDAIGPSAPSNQDSTNDAVNWFARTRTLTGDPETQKIQARATVRYQLGVTGARPQVTAGTKLDSTETDMDPNNSPALIGVLTGTFARAVTGITNATPIVLTLDAFHGYDVGDFVDVTGIMCVNGISNANGRWRISASGSTTITLQGSSGNGAYSYGGQVKRVTEADFQTSNLEQGQGVWFNLDGYNRTTSFFELHGIRAAFYERNPVMSA